MVLEIYVCQCFRISQILIIALFWPSLFQAYDFIPIYSRSLKTVLFFAVWFPSIILGFSFPFFFFRNSGDSDYPS